LVTVSSFYAAVLLVHTACGGGQQSTEAGDGETTAPAAAGAADAGDASDQKYPDIVDAKLEPTGETWTLEVTVSSPYDSPERYADGWRVLSPDGRVLGKHEFLHDHANEQPFTRTQTGLKIPKDVNEITVEGHDQENGYGGKTVTVAVDRG
jgi:hypothetical protein